MSSLIRSLSDASDMGDDVGFSTSFWKMLNERKDTHDVYFGYKNSESCFSAHKLVLAIRSSYFADILYHQEKIENIIVLKDEIKLEDFKDMITYMYGYTPSITTPQKAYAMYKVAEEFQVISLMDLCKKKLNNMQVVTSNIFDMLKVAECMQDTITKSRCLRFFQENTRHVFATNDQLSEICPSVIKILLTSRRLSLDHVNDLLAWIFTWAKNRYLENHSYTSSREAIEEFLPQLPFASLSVQEFADLYSRYQDQFLHKNEIISFFMKYTLPERPLEMPYWYNEGCRVEIITENNE